MLRKLFAGATTEVTEPRSAIAPRAARDDDRTLEAAASLIRLLGDFALDTADRSAAETEALASAWSDHLLLLRPRPGDPPGQAPKQRDLVGAVRFATELRKAETAYVTSALTDLRQTVWAFVHAFNRMLADDVGADASVADQLERLRTAASHGSLEELRHTAVSTAGTIEAMVKERSRKLESQRRELGQRLARLDRELDEARRERHLDPLTGLANRGALDQHLTRAVDLRAMHGEPFCLVMVDVDHFKGINDRFGHPVGDVVLRRVAQGLSQTFLRKRDLVARYGGEEFAVVLADADLAVGLRLAERARGSLAALVLEAGLARLRGELSGVGMALDGFRTRLARRKNEPTEDPARPRDAREGEP